MLERMDHWQTFLNAIGGKTSLVNVLGFLLVAWLQYRYNAQLTRLTGSVQTMGKMQEISYTWLHERRAKVIEELHSKLIKAREVFTMVRQALLIYNLDNPEEENKALAKIGNGFDILKKLSELYKANEIFFENDLMEKLNQITQGFNTMNLMGTEPGNRQMDLKRLGKLTALDQVLDILTTDIRNDFRALLGVEVKKQNWLARLRASQVQRRLLKQIRG